MSRIILTKAPPPATEEEVLFIRGFPFFAPKTSKKVALGLDNGLAAEKLIEQYKGFKHPYLGVDVSGAVEHFIRFYVAHTDRARELFNDYSKADLDRCPY